MLLRHGESTWNALDLFAGWVNIPLSDTGEQEARRAGRQLAAAGLLPGQVHTSVQRRAIQTADLALAQCDRDWIPVRRTWRLNSNHYGALQGRSKAQVRAQLGEQAYRDMHRRYDSAPPPIPDGDQYSQAGDPRYAAIPGDLLPRGESLADVTARLLPYWYDAIVPGLAPGGCVLVVSHGNTLRALVKHLDRVSDAGSADLEVPTGQPVLYELDARHRPVAPGGRRLPPAPGPDPGPDG